MIDQKDPALVVGPPGIGKSTLVAEASRRLGRELVVAPCLDLLRDTPLHPFTVLLGQPASGDADRVAEQVALVVGDGVLLLDDLQWADPHTLAVLDPLTERVRVVATLRRGSEPSVAAAIESARAAGAALIEVRPLDAAESAELVRALAGTVPEAIVAARCARAGGNPLFLEDLCRQDTGASTLDEHLRLRLAQLAPSASRAMSLLALARRPLAISGGGFDVSPDALRDLIVAGLIVESDGEARVSADVIGEVAEASTPPAVAADLHRLLADELERCGHLVDAARHAEAAGERARAHQLAQDAAGQAHAGTHERVTALVLAAETAPPDAGAELRMVAAWESMGLDETNRVRSLLAPDELFAASSVVPAERYLLLALASLRDDHPDDAAVLVETALATLDDSDSRLHGQLLGLRAGIRAQQFDPRAMADAEAALASAERYGAPKAAVLLVLGGAHGIVGGDRWRTLLPAAIAAARDEGIPALELEAGVTLLFVSYFHNEVASAEQWCGDLVERARELGRRGAEQALLLTDATNRLFIDASSDAVIHRLEEILANPATRTNRVGGTALLWLGRADRGRADSAIGALEVLRSTSSPDDLLGRGAIDWVLAESHFLQRSLEEAEHHARAAAAPALIGRPCFDAGAALIAWSQIERGLAPEGPRPLGMVPALAGLPLEADAVTALGVARRTGDSDAATTAITAFEAATALHVGSPGTELEFAL